MIYRLHVVNLVLSLLVVLFFITLGAAVSLLVARPPAAAADMTPSSTTLPLSNVRISNLQFPISQSPNLTISEAPALPTTPPWPTMQYTPTATPPIAPLPAHQLPTSLPVLPPPQRVPVNNLPWESIIVLPPEAVAHAREIFAAGQALGRNAHAFSKVGDSTTENPHFLARFDDGPYYLGPYAYLQPAIDHFHGSYGRDSLAVSIGLHAWTANDPMWADSALCLPNETPVACEIRVHNPAFLIIRLGTNDVGVGASFDANIRRIVDTAIAAGVVPIIGTKGDRHEGSNENNDILRRVAADYRLPLWDYDQVAGTLPGRGLDVDAAHMLTFYSHDYTDPTAFTRGHAMHNLTALMMLDAVWREVMGE